MTKLGHHFLAISSFLVNTNNINNFVLETHLGCIKQAAMSQYSVLTGHRGTCSLNTLLSCSVVD